MRTRGRKKAARTARGTAAGRGERAWGRTDRRGLTTRAIEDDATVRDGARDVAAKRRRGGVRRRGGAKDIRGGAGGGGRAAAATGRLQVLDATGYAERFLAVGARDRGNCDRALVMSVILGVNEKFRQGVDGFGAFAGEEGATAFRNALESALDAYASLTTIEKTACLMFLIKTFASLENEAVRAVALPLVSLPLWNKLSEGRLQLELTKHESLAKHHSKMLKKEAKAAKKAAEAGEAHVPIGERRESCWLVRVMDDFVSYASDATNEDGVRFCERFMEIGD